MHLFYSCIRLRPHRHIVHLVLRALACLVFSFGASVSRVLRHEPLALRRSVLGLCIQPQLWVEFTSTVSDREAERDPTRAAHGEYSTSLPRPT